MKTIKKPAGNGVLRLGYHENVHLPRTKLENALREMYQSFERANEGYRQIALEKYQEALERMNHYLTECDNWGDEVDGARLKSFTSEVESALNKFNSLHDYGLSEESLGREVDRVLARNSWANQSKGHHYRARNRKNLPKEPCRPSIPSMVNGMGDLCFDFEEDFGDLEGQLFRYLKRAIPVQPTAEEIRARAQERESERIRLAKIRQFYDEYVAKHGALPRKGHDKSYEEGFRYWALD